jgi:hypothetical protein
MGTGGSFPKDKAAGACEADHSLPVGDDVKNIRIYSSIRLHGIVLS